jgi:hypothetical protein
MTATIVIPSISADGRYVCSFLNPTLGALGAYGSLLLQDLVQGTNIALFGMGSGETVYSPFISPDGTRIAGRLEDFRVGIRNLGSGLVSTSSATWKPPGILAAAEVSLSRDGRLMLVNPTTNNFPQVLDLATGAVDEMKLGTARPSLPIYASARLSPSGRRILFTSAQQELEPGEREWLSRVWVYDRVTKSLELLSPETGSGLRFSGAGAAYWLGDESGVIFSGGSGFQILSMAGDQMLPIVRRIALVLSDTDGDGLDDDWERQNFGSLAKNGTDDEDGDGLSNYAEFILGSNPKDASSGLRPVTQTVSAGSRRLEWPASPGVGYRVEYSASLAPGSWTQLTNVVANLGSIATCTDPNTAGVSNRFYRVIAVP